MVTAQVRLFAGFPVPPPVVERLSAFRLRHATPKDGLRWSAPEQWHITLRFFGELPSAQAANLITHLKQLRAPAISLRIGGFGAFETKGILFADVEHSATLLEAFRGVEVIASVCGMLPETRPLRPHVTLARARNRTGAATLRAWMQSAAPAFGAPISWTAREVVIYESVLGRQGASYASLAHIPLMCEPSHIGEAG